MGISVQSNYYPGGGTPMRSLCSVFCVLCSEFCDLCSVFHVLCSVHCSVFCVLFFALCTVQRSSQFPNYYLGGGTAMRAASWTPPFISLPGTKHQYKHQWEQVQGGFTTKHQYNHQWEHVQVGIHHQTWGHLIAQFAQYGPFSPYGHPW